MKFLSLMSLLGFLSGAMGLSVLLICPPDPVPAIIWIGGILSLIIGFSFGWQHSVPPTPRIYRAMAFGIGVTIAATLILIRADVFPLGISYYPRWEHLRYDVLIGGNRFPLHDSLPYRNDHNSSCRSGVARKSIPCRSFMKISSAAQIINP